ncbi:hypothetical protein [Streptococcus sciuri]|uniref:Uncharacterized protein n=1 Tax=Streptococcus sciuri TaxID=2973939 RepID=A0ABT2F7A4_9STRE|nr:hypothetical protein [Streptococcus sciuri]MCS4488361.1 hypothetical protein [Streptococcus sciuri]
MLEKVIVIVLVISYLFDKQVQRRVRRAEIEKLKQETKKLALDIKKASK